MRSYHEHLQQTRIHPEKRPVFRSSAIFPVFRQQGITCRLIFLGYWHLKRGIADISALISLRSLKGEVLCRVHFNVETPTAHRIELDDLLKQVNYPHLGFEGSLEIEFYSSKNIVFPFPAVSINYYGPSFSSVVHSAQRVYNDYEDMRVNSQTTVPESGFNLHVTNNHEPVIGIINGPEELKDEKVDVVIYNSQGEKLSAAIDLGVLNPYETRFLFLARELELASFLGGEVGSAKLSFHLNWIFPRLLVGNLQKNPVAFVTTHSYYDCSKATSESDYWRKTETPWYPANLLVPFRITDEIETKFYFYPIYSPSAFSIDIEIYTADGRCLGGKTDLIHISNQLETFHEINIRSLLKELTIKETGDLGIRLMAKTAEGQQVPARIKIAVDIGQNKDTLPCNFCTNMQPFNPEWEGKVNNFRWVPLLADQPGAATWLMNSSPKKEWKSKAKLLLTFYRESDEKTLSREVVLPPHGFLVIRPEQDLELKEFFEGKVGWLSAISSEPYLTTYYFVEHPSGIVGGDHGY